MIKLLLVYDSTVSLRLIQWALTDAIDMFIVGCASDPMRVRDLARATLPDVVLLDSDYEILRLLLHSELHCKLLVCCDSLDPDAQLDFVRSGASGVVVGAQRGLLPQAIRRVHAGELWVSRAHTTTLIDELRDRNARCAQLSSLTPRQEIVPTLCKVGDSEGTASRENST